MLDTPAYNLARTIFAEAQATGPWNTEAFSAWRLKANMQDWEHLERAWQSEDCPESFSWSVLKEAVEQSACRVRCALPLPTLGTFLFPRDTVVHEGFWLDWQTDDVKKNVYQTAQHWTEAATSELDEHAQLLLRIAVSSSCMPEWRAAPNKCVENINWYDGMRTLNGCTLTQLIITDIERIPLNNTPVGNEGPLHNTLISTMIKSCNSNWKTVARCIEDKAGPGLWLTYVLSGDKKFMESRRAFAWNNMKLDGVDAWAMSQFIRPAASFEQSFDGMLGYKPVLQYKEWAHQWWLQCVLGMDSAQALDMVRSIHSGVRAPESFEVNAALLSSDNCAVS